MRKWKVLALATAVTTGIALLASCGGSDSNNSDATKSARAAAPLAAKALTVASLGSQVQNRSGRLNKTVAAAPAAHAAPASGLNAAVARFQRGSNASALSARTNTAQALTASPCTTGTATTTGNTTVYENCTYSVGNMMYFEDGTITVASVDLADSSTFNFDAGTTTKPYVFRESILVNGTMSMPVFEMSATAKITGTNTGKTCASEYGTGYANSIMNMNGEFRIKEYSGTAINEDFMLKTSGLSEVVAVAKFDMAKCDPMDVTVTENGLVALTDNVNSVNNMSMSATNLVMHAVASTNTAMQDVLTTSLTGTVEVASSCFTGSLTFATIEPIVQVLDEGEVDECPIAGKLAFSGSAVGTIKYTVTGGVEIDNGSDGSVDQSFKSCEDADICS